MTGLDYLTSFRCVVCGTEHPRGTVEYVCPCGDAFCVLDTLYDYARLRADWDRDSLTANPDPSLWRYLPLLPVAADGGRTTDAASASGGDDGGRRGTPGGYPESQRGVLRAVASLLANAGGTPLYAAPRVSEALGVREVWIKDDGRNPTGSLKDRASAVTVLKALERGAQTITTASSGNAAAALAGMAASVGLRAVIFVPETAPAAKVAQLLMFGAEVYLVQGTYDEAFDVCLAASAEYGWYCRNTGYNPYTVEGKKTVSLEICESLGWDAPDRVLVSVGDGNIIAGVWKGLRDLAALGWIAQMPRITGVQAAGSDGLATAWERGTEVVEPIHAQTVADSICVGIPRDPIRALRAVRETGGEYVRVADESILAAMPRLAQTAGVFAEPAGATAFAGLLELAEQGKLAPDERIVVIVTGNGLKDIPSAMRAVGQATRIEPTLESLARVVAF